MEKHVLKDYSVGGTLPSPACLPPGESQDSSRCFLSKHSWMNSGTPVLSNPTNQRTGHTAREKQVLKDYSMGGTLPSPACLTTGESQDSSWCFLSKHVEWIMVPPYQFNLQWWGSKSSHSCLAIHLHPWHENHPREKCFLTRSKWPGRLPRSVKVKGLIPQKKVKEWVQKSTSNQDCYKWGISHNKQWWRLKCKSQLEIYLKQVLENSFTLGWQGNNRHSCKGALPSLQLSLHRKIWTLSSET